MISYAQHYEDIILATLLKDVKNGVYVDVGANDPIKDSVTYFFYRKGWSGVNIEPMPSVYKKLVKSRKRDRNINVGISDKDGVLTLREIGWERHGLSTFKPSAKIPEYLPYVEYSVKVKTLAEVLKDLDHIDFMKIDVEGMEFEVLNGYDWRVKPEVIVIEDNGAEKWLPLLEKQKYKQVCFDGLNRYFVPENSSRDMNGFQDVLNQEVIPLPQHKLTQDNQSLEARLTKLAGEYSNTQKFYDQLRGEHHELQTNPEQFFSIKRLARALLVRVGLKCRSLLRLP